MSSTEDLAEILKSILKQLHYAEKMILDIPFEPTYDYQNKINTARLEVANILNAVDQFDMGMTDENDLMTHPLTLLKLKEIIDRAREQLDNGVQEGVLDELEDFIDDTDNPDNYRSIASEELHTLKKRVG